MKQKFRLAGLVLTTAAVLALQACGGDDSAPATTSVPVTVIDGAVGNAVVCLDKNANGVCDAGEPSGRTDAAGNVTLQVDNADAGKYPILAVIGTDAVDADHGPVGVAYTMAAPADKPAVVSPLTTLVQAIVASAGTTSAQAEANVKAQTGITVSLFQDYTKSTSAESQAAGSVARMIVVTTQQQSEVIKSQIGAKALDNSVITKADLDEAIQRKLLELLPSLVAALNDPAVTNAATPAQKEAALLAQANSIVASSGLTASSVATVVAINNQAPATTAEAPAASGTLQFFSFNNVNDWGARIYAATLAQNTPVNGMVRYVTRRALASGNATYTARWNEGSAPNRQSDIHFNGTAWVGCAVNQEYTQTARDAAGNSDYNTCDSLEIGRTTRATFDVSNTPMIDVYNQVRNAGYANLTINSSASMLGTATFPANTKLFYQTSNVTSTAPAYLPGGNNIAQVTSLAVANGRTSASDTTAPCANTGNYGPAYQTPATSLDQMVERYPGKPCVGGTSNQSLYTSAGTTATFSSGSRNDGWGSTSISVGTIGNASTGSSTDGPYQSAFYTANTLYRVAFGAGSTTTYLSCQQRASDGSARNCNSIGTGSYTVTSMGNARVMTLNNTPSAFVALGSDRVFVERDGKVYIGYKNRAVISSSARLNLVGLNALFNKLGLSSVDVETPMALTRTSYAGDWRFSDTNEVSGYSTITIKANGTIACTWNDPAESGSDNCSLTSFDPATGAISVKYTGTGNDDGVFAATFNFLTGAITNATYSPTPGGVVSLSGARR